MVLLLGLVLISVLLGSVGDEEADRGELTGSAKILLFHRTPVDVEVEAEVAVPVPTSSLHCTIGDRWSDVTPSVALVVLEDEVFDM